MRFLCEAALIDQVAGYLNQPKLAAIHTMNLELTNYTILKPCYVIGLRNSNYSLERSIKILKAAAQAMTKKFDEKIR